VSRLYLLEPEPSPAWEPFAGVRPVAELRAGAWLLRERWEAAVGSPATGIVGEHVADFADTEGPPVLPTSGLTGPAVVARSEVVPPRAPLVFPPGTRRLTAGGHTVAWRLEAGEPWTGPDVRGEGLETGALPLRGAWDLVTVLERLLAADCDEFTAAAADPVPAGSIVLGNARRVVCLDAAVEPGVVFDTRQGAVVLAEGVIVRSGTRLEGPLFAGPGTVLLGGALRHCSFGPACRVHGEVAFTVMTGYSNKSHDGFLGHSVLGQWVNLGAGTITSNLKNTYGEVRLHVPGGTLDTGRQLLGSLVADHAKTAIGTLLGTGTVVGAGANVFGGPVPPFVRPFAWGPDETARVEVEGFVRTAGRVFPRRQVSLTPERERHLRALHRRLVR
jgi:UDP-N-acetylglucosamine diphosphorylase/glucosamine-1-phosphate N-acetyltransferase